MTAALSQDLTSAISTTTLAGRPSVSKKALWGGRLLSGLGVAFMLLDAAMKVAKAAPAVEGTLALGYAESTVRPLGLLQLLLVVLYVYPRTAVLGAVLWTGYLGGAIATHVRLGNPLVSHVLAPVYVGLALWGGLWLRDRSLRSQLPLRG